MKIYAIFFLITIFLSLGWDRDIKILRDFFVLILVTYLFVITGWRSYTVGTDTINYVSFFSYLGSPISDMHFFDLLEMLHARFEYGYVLLNRLVYHFTENPRWLLIICALITYCMLFVFLKKVSKDPYLSLVMFVCLGYMASGMNTIRQGIAAAFIMISYIFLLKKRGVFLCIFFIVLAFLFHKTAILFLLAVFLRNWKFTKKNVVVLLLGSFLVSIIYGKLENLINQINYTDYANSGITSGYLGITLNILLLLYFLVICVMSIKNTNLMLHKDIKLDSDILPILIIISIGVYIVAFNFSQLTRIASYFEIAAIVYVPNCLRTIENIKLRMTLVWLTYIVLLFYFFIIIFLRPQWTNITPYVFG